VDRNEGITVEVTNVEFSGNGVLKESRYAQGQKAGHVGVPTFACSIVGRGGESWGVVALTRGLRSKGTSREEEFAHQGTKRAHRRPVNSRIRWCTECETAESGLYCGVQRVGRSEQ
jgi:hypothetical protein